MKDSRRFLSLLLSLGLGRFREKEPFYLLDNTVRTERPTREVS